MLRIKNIWLFFIVIFLTSSSLAQSESRQLLEKYVVIKSLSAGNLSLTLSNLANLYDIPIGFEPKNFKKDKKVKDKQDIETSFQLKDGTIEGVLNQIAALHPDYNWKMENGVIHVFPKNDLDPILTNLLNTNINEILIEKRLSVMSVGDSICDIPLVKNKLKDLGVTNIHFFNTIQSRNLDERGQQTFFLIKNSNVREILNQIVKESQAKYWTIVRWGEKGEFLTILVS